MTLSYGLYRGAWDPGNVPAAQGWVAEHPPLQESKTSSKDAPCPPGLGDMEATVWPSPEQLGEKPKEKAMRGQTGRERWSLEGAPQRSTPHHLYKLGLPAPLGKLCPSLGGGGVGFP